MGRGLGALVVGLWLGGCGPRSSERPCDAPEPHVQPGTDLASGYERCESGLLIRIEPVACGDVDSWAGDCRELANPQGVEGPDFSCIEDADCDGGFCRGSVAPWPTCTCYPAPSCTSDADCGEDAVCWCSGSRTRCIAAECRTNADCDGDSLCGLVAVSDECGESRASLACTTPDDACHTATDCAAFEQCEYVQSEGRRACRPTVGPCG